MYPGTSFGTQTGLLLINNDPLYTAVQNEPVSKLTAYLLLLLLLFCRPFLVLTPLFRFPHRTYSSSQLLVIYHQSPPLIPNSLTLLLQTPLSFLPLPHPFTKIIILFHLLPHPHPHPITKLHLLLLFMFFFFRFPCAPHSLI